MVVKPTNSVYVGSPPLDPPDDDDDPEQDSFDDAENNDYPE